MSILNKPYPNTVEECLDLFKKIEYKCFGTPMIMITYNYLIKNSWNIAFRNPANFTNPDINEATPLLACHKMLDFLLDLKEKRNLIIE